MAIINTPSTVAKNDLLRSERIAGGILPKILTSFDMIVIVVAAILWIPNAAIITGAGAAGYTYWLLGFLTFLIPGAVVTGQLGLMFPGEGSIYVWTTKAFGNFMGFFAGFCAWWPSILNMVAAGTTVVSLMQLLGSLFGMNLLPTPGQQGLIIIGVIIISFIMSVLRFRVTQNLVNILFVSYGGAILLIGLAGVLWLITGHQINAHVSLQMQNWIPSKNNFTFYGTVVLALLGIEVPLNMGVEIKDIRSIKHYLVWGSIVVMFAYLIATFGVMMVVPLPDQSSPAGIIEAIQIGFGPAGKILAIIADLIFISCFIAIAAVYNYSYARLLFVSGLDRRLPAIISKVSMNKVPWVAVLAQTIIAIAFTAIIFVLAPLSLKSDGLAALIYEVVEASVTVIWCVSMVILFLNIFAIRHKFPTTFARSRFAPLWVFYVSALIGSIASIAGIYVVFTAPWTSLTDVKQWDAWIVSITVISLMVAIIGFYIGRATIKNDLSDEEIIKEVTN